VRDGETGLHAEPGDVADFAEKIARIWGDAELTRRLGRGARAHVDSQFAERVHFDRLVRVYAEAQTQMLGFRQAG
jgi:glycosyltransferase involved in cell wall biosynthesis